MSIPGVQKPHCSAFLARNASCKSWNSPLSEAPSIVVTSSPSTCTARIVQARAVCPLMLTVHAPQTPDSHPTWVPVSSNSIRKKSAKDIRGSTIFACNSPLTLNEMSLFSVVIYPSPWANTNCARTRRVSTLA